LRTRHSNAVATESLFMVFTCTPLAEGAKAPQSEISDVNVPTRYRDRFMSIWKKVGS
jgi:hypothetical protein